MQSQEEIDQRFMQDALALARLALRSADVPIGAVVVWRNQVIGRGCNQREKLRDPTAHAEIIALGAAAEHRGQWRLDGCTVYVTLEPCPMCAGALVNARVDRLVYGASDPKAGACGSLFEIPTDPRLNHRLTVTSDVLAAESVALLQDFFRRQRQQGKK